MSDQLDSEENVLKNVSLYILMFKFNTLLGPQSSLGDHDLNKFESTEPADAATQVLTLLPITFWENVWNILTNIS